MSSKAARFVFNSADTTAYDLLVFIGGASVLQVATTFEPGLMELAHTLAAAAVRTSDNAAGFRNDDSAAHPHMGRRSSSPSRGLTGLAAF